MAWKSSFRQNYRTTFSPTVPTSSAGISHVMADVEAPGGEKWEHLKSGGKQWQTTPKNLPKMQRTRAIPVAWLNSGLCPDRPKGWIPIIIIITTDTIHFEHNVLVWCQIALLMVAVITVVAVFHTHTPWSRVLYERFTASQETPRRFTTAHTRACHLSLSQKRLIQSHFPPASCFLKFYFWGTFAELWKVTVSLVTSLHLQQLRPRWTEIYLTMFRKLSNSGLSDSNNKYFTCRAVHLWYVAELFLELKLFQTKL